MQKSSTNSDRKVYCADALLAAEKGQEALAKFLSDNHITIDYYYNDARPLLKSAILEVDGYTDRLRTILSFNPNFFLMSKDKWQETAIHTAARINKPEYLKVLLEAAKKKGQLFEALNSKDGRGNTPLAWACTNREEGMIDILLGYGADATIPNLIGKQPIDFLTDHPNLAQKVQAQIEKQKQQKTSTSTHAVMKATSPQSTAIEPASPQEIKTKRPLFKFDQVDINRARLEMKLTDSGMVMYLKEFTNYKKHGHKLLNPELPSFAKVYVVLEHLILSLDLEKIVELEKILDDEAEMLWQSGFDSSKSSTFSNILHSIKLPGPVPDQNGLSSEDFARSKLLPWFEQHRSCPAIVRIYGEDDFEKSIKTLSKKSAPSEAVVQMIKRKVERTFNLGFEQSEAVIEYVKNKTQPQQQQATSSAIPVPPIPPKPVQRRNSMDNTKSPAAFFSQMGPARQKTPSPPQDGSLSGSAESPPKSTSLIKSEGLSLNEQLKVAIERNDVDEAERLVKCGAKANSDLFLQVVEAKKIDFIPALFHAGAKLTAEILIKIILDSTLRIVVLPTVIQFKEGFGLKECINDVYNEATPLWVAAKIDDLDVMKLLLDNGADPNVGDEKLPIHIVCINRNKDGVILLLQYGALINQIDSTGTNTTALALALINGNDELACFLLQNGADPMIKSQNLSTALHSAAIYNCIRTIHLIISFNKVDVNIRAPKQFHFYTPLHLAASSGHVSAVKALLEKGADPLAEANNGEIPLDRALEENHLEVVRLLLPYGTSEFTPSLIDKLPLELQSQFQKEPARKCAVM